MLWVKSRFLKSVIYNENARCIQLLVGHRNPHTRWPLYEDYSDLTNSLSNYKHPVLCDTLLNVFLPCVFILFLIFHFDIEMKFVVNFSFKPY